jgi:hypothetical protein
VGKSAKRGGRQLAAELTEVMGSSFYFDVTVQSIDDSHLEGPVVFHLHDTYRRSAITIKKIRHGKQAVL